MPPLEVGKKYFVKPKRDYADIISNLKEIMNNADIKKPLVAKYLGGDAFLFDSDTAALGVHTEIPHKQKFYWNFTPEDGGDPVAVDDKHDPKPPGGGRTRKRTRRARKTRRRHR